MAKKVQGIIVGISGDATGLNNELKKVDNQVKNTNKQLKEVNGLIKFNPKNTELLAQKQRLLSDNIESATNKLKTLKSQDAEMQSAMKSGKISAEQYERFKREIIATEGQLKSYNSQLKDVEKSTKKLNIDKLSDSFSNLGKKVASVSFKAITTGVAAISTALIGLTTASVKSYADLEQNIGGVETLFGDSAKTVIKNAENAYKTAGVSANQYMETVTSFSASLLQSLGGDTEKAAQKADMALIDMSDNANKMGTSMESIQSAYQGFAKQNYTMLDNLKLGYGGTKTEMERLLSDAEKITGIKYDISNLSDVYDAIHIIQGELGITGTTAKEATQTITGSVNATKSAFQNFLSGSGGIDQVIEMGSYALKNILAAIKKMLPSIIKGLSKLIVEIAKELPDLLSNLLPPILEGAVKALEEFAKALIDNLPILLQSVLNMLPQILQSLITLTITIITSLSQQLPTMLPMIIEAILDLIPMLIDNLPLFIDAAFQLGMGLLTGLLNSIPKILESIPKIITSLLKYFLQMPKKMIDIGLNMVKGLWDGLKNSFDWIKNKIKDWVGNVLKFIKKLFGIASPSKKTKQDGIFIAQGLANGILDGLPYVEKAVSKMATTVDGTLNSDINVNGNSKKSGSIVNNFTFYAQTLDDAQINKVVKEVNKSLGKAY